MAARGTYPKGVAKRDEILRVALDVFAREGYWGTSLREIAKAAGLSLPGLMHYFDSKEDLLVQVLAKRQIVDLALVAGDGEDSIERLLLVMRHNAEVPGLVQLYSTLAAAASNPDHPAHQYFASRFQSIRAIAAEYIANQIAEKRIPSRLDPTQTASVLLAVADGMQLQWMVDPTIDMAEHIDYTWRMLTAQ